MKLEVNIKKGYFLFLLGMILLFLGGLVYAWGGNDPEIMGHSLGEVQHQPIPRMNATWYSWQGSGNKGTTLAHDYCFLTKVYAHDDNHNDRTQGCFIEPLNSSNFDEPQNWTKRVLGSGGESYCAAICLDE